jgi:hypothetical protein
VLVQEFERWLIDEGRFEFVPSVQESWRQRDEQAEANAGPAARVIEIERFRAELDEAVKTSAA